MSLTLILLVIVGVLELQLYSAHVWRLRRILGVIFLIGQALLTGYLLGSHFRLLTVVIALLQLYRLLNLLRYTSGIAHGSHIRHAGWQTSLSILLGQLTVLILAVVRSGHGWWRPVLYGAALVQCLLGLILLLALLKNTRSLRLPKELASTFTDKQLPSVSICIPARNETAELERCLTAVLANDYPKLEILVLDDCSQDKTAETIKSFAHAGIRFLHGSVPPENWLAKNWAYQQLYEAASGRVLLFCGVDVDLSPQSVRLAVATMLQQNLKMASFLPVNRHARPLATLLQPIRYAWELALPRGIARRPAVLSTCWLVQREFLHRHGGFGGVTRSVTPESYAAWQAAAAHSYHFLHGGRQLGIYSDKAPAEQWQTAVRTRYPQLHRRLELVALLSGLELLIVAAPFIAVTTALSHSSAVVTALAVAATILYAVNYVVITHISYERFLPTSLVSWLPAVLLDVAARHVSFWRYEFSEVIWKGRNICLPVMQRERHD